MQIWQEGLLAWAVLWAGQGAGTWMQMRHYPRAMRRIQQDWPDGYLGTGAARSTFGRGAIALVVASPDQRVRQVLLMEGRSVFASFRDCPEAVGLDLTALPEAAFATQRKGRRKALAGAVAQIQAAIRAAVAPVSVPHAA